MTKSEHILNNKCDKNLPVHSVTLLWISAETR